MKTNFDRNNSGLPNFELGMRIVLLAMLASLVLFVTGLFVGYLRDTFF